MNLHPLFRQGVAFLLVLAIFSSFTTVHAAAGQIIITATVGSDTTAPSVPAGLSATAISSSQVDLIWTASTDNVAVTGYKIYRDAVYLTTVVGTTYSDIGLTASTLYTYTVSAIDGSGNESAQSASASATTFAAVVVTPTPTPVTGGNGGGISGVQSPVIYDVTVVADKTTAVIEWKTNVPTTGTLSWGKTSAYEISASNEVVATLIHRVTISGLSAGTDYVYTIDAVNGYGTHSFLTNQKFTTLSLESAPTNAQSFTATAETKDILLNWLNPQVSDFAEVRIVRSSSFFPSDPNDGEVVYEGGSENFVDTQVTIGTRYYYTLFVKYQNGAYSSGLVATARIGNQGEVSQPVDIFGQLPDAPRVHPLINALTFADFDFIQNGKKLDTADGKSVAIDGGKNLTVSLSYEKVPELLKTIAITLTDPDDETKTFSFLLRVNSDKTAYIATLSPLGKSGRYGVRISIVDYQNRGLKRIVGNLVASVQSSLEGKGGIADKVIALFNESFLDLILLLILLWLVIRALHEMVQRHKKSTAFIGAVPVAEKHQELVPLNLCPIEEIEEQK